MRKRFKRKKRIRFKKFIYLIFIFMLIYLFKFSFSKLKIDFYNDKLLDNILNNTYSYNNISNSLKEYLGSNLFNKPVELLSFEYQNTNSKLDEINFIYEENEIPNIYIYNSHQGEEYNSEYLENYDIIPNVLMASKMLKDKLKNYNMNALVMENDILKYMEEKKLTHWDSYIASRHFLEPIVKKYSNMDLYIDLHRDAATHEVTYTEINGKSCAKILFVIGLENLNYKKNLEIVKSINNIILEKYPTLTRGIMKKQGYGVNGIYNQDLSEKVILIEIGGNNNNLEEVNNTLDILAEVLGEYINEKE